MADSGSDMTPGPGMTAGSKMPWAKIAAVVIILIVIVAGFAAWRLASPTAPQSTPTTLAPSIGSVTADRGATDTGVPVSFTSTATDPENDTLTFTWRFGDGVQATGATVSHAYRITGRFIAILEVSDNHNNVVRGDSKAVFVQVLHPETRSPEVAPPTGASNPVALASADRPVISAGDTVTFNGNSSWTWWWDGGAWTFADAASSETAVPTLWWFWGDGQVDVGTPTQVGQITHTYNAAGTYTVKLIAVNYLGRVDVAGYTILVTPTPPPSSFVKNPDVFNFVTFGEPDSLDPAYDYETSGGQIVQNVAEGLIWYQREHADVFNPMLAVKVPSLTDPADVSPNGLTYNFTLKPNLRFHSGNPVDCAAVKFSIERVLVLNDAAGPAWILDQSLTAYAVDDPLTPTVDERLVAIQNSVSCPQGPTGLAVQFHLAIPYPAFLSTLAFTAADVIDPSPDAYRVTGRCPADPATGKPDLMKAYCHDQLVGTGPFKLRAWQPNQQIILDRNPTYHRAATQAVPFREVHVLKANDQATRVLMLKAGDADAITLDPSHKNDIRDAQGNVLPGIVEQTGDTFIVQFLGFNQNINVGAAPPGDVNVPADFFRDIHLRKAFSYAWKYTDFINNVLFGLGSPLCGPVPKGMFSYDATVPCYNFDLTKAQAEFQQALDPRSPSPTDTYWDNGFTITIYYNIGNLAREEGARQLQQTLQSLNSKFVVKVQGLEWASFLQSVRNKISALFFLGWAPDYADPDDYVFPFLHSTGFFPRRVSYSNASLDQNITAQAQEVNPAARLVILQRIQRAPYYDVPYIWTHQSKNYDVLRSWVQGYYANPMTTAGTGYYFYDIRKA